jgi:DNA-binding GntR family transcriptional regulator
MNATFALPPKPLIKEAIAATLREKIISGEIEPGEVVVEGKWAGQLGAAQGSVREAINMLASEGFVRKVPGHRATVIKFGDEDVRQIYRLRSYIEGLAARLVVEQRADISEMHRAWAGMNSAAATGNIRELVNADLRFHLSLCEGSGNRFLLEQAQRLLVPLFAFVLMRVYTNQRGSQPWAASFGLHGRILEVIRMGDPFIAEQVVIRATDTFAVVAYQDWEGGSTPVSQ